MHVAKLLDAKMFGIEIEGRHSDAADLFPHWNTHDRFGLVIDEALGGLGASHLLQVALTAFYDIRPSRRESMAIYPDIYAFHIGKGRGAHAPFDFWPARREVILETADHREILDAINDRGITRLAVPDRPRRKVDHRPKEEDAARDRIVSAFVYKADGRTADADIAIRGLDRRTEHNPTQVFKASTEIPKYGLADNGRPVKELDPSYVNWLKARFDDVTEAERDVAQARREALKTEGLATETYRRVDVTEALERLASAGIV